MRYICAMNPFKPQDCVGRLPSFSFQWVLLALVILTSVAMGGEDRPSDAVTVFHCTFGQEWDVNYDNWPDRWVRKTGPEYPHYVSIGIAEDNAAAGGRVISIGLEGAAVAVASPPIRIMPRFSYLLEARLKNERLVHSKVFLTLEFCDSSGKVLQTTRSPLLGTTKGWELIRVGPVEVVDPAIDRVVIGLEVYRRSKGDLYGNVSLADVWLGRLPRISVSTNNACNVYTELDNVVIRCELSGIREPNPEIRFHLFDATNQERQNHQTQLNGKLIVDATATAAKDTAQPPDGYEGFAEWRPTIPDYGYYRIVVRMLSGASSNKPGDADRQLASRTIHLAVVPPLPPARRGEFTWTLPEGDAPLTYQDLSRLLPQVGINWVKVPVWFDADDPRRTDELIRFVELLGASNIEVVGIIDRAPQNTELGARTTQIHTVAELLPLDPTAWSASLEPVMSRLSLRVRWWQLGADRDTSLVGYPALSNRIAELRTALFRFGQDVRLGINWDRTDTELPQGEVAWDFQQLAIDNPDGNQQFTKFLAKPRQNSAQHWIAIEPPPPANDPTLTGEQALFARASEFVHRLVSAKIHEADAIVISNPFDEQRGLMHASGMPAELLLPWRTTALMLAGADYLGEIQLPGNSPNRIFRRPDDRVVMVVWNDVPTQEVLYLGAHVQQIDILGRTSQPAQQGHEQVITVWPTPTFVLGLNEAVTRWRMAVAFEKTQVPSIFAKPHRNSLRIKNYFPQGVGGSLKIVVPQERLMEDDARSKESGVEASGLVPDRWTIDPPQANFQLAPGQEWQLPFEIRLKNALFGKQPVRIDFKVEADEPYQFSVYRQMEVGTEDLTLQVNTRLDKDGTLIVEQLMTNRTDRLADFRCYLHAKGHRRQRMQVYRLGKSPDRKLYRFANGQELIGKEMLLEIEELNGPRMLKYRFVAKDQPLPPATSSEAEGKSADEAPAESNTPVDGKLAKVPS